MGPDLNAPDSPDLPDASGDSGFALEPAPAAPKPIRSNDDQRLTVPEPLPVRLNAIADVRLPCPPGVDAAMDALYVSLLKFERLRSDEFHLFYRADNHNLIFQVHNRPVGHDRLAPTMIEVDSLDPLQRHFVDTEFPFQWMRGLTPGGDYLLFQDPAGNWIGVSQRRIVS
jgi:hypothetical protein